MLRLQLLLAVMYITRVENSKLNSLLNNSKHRRDIANGARRLTRNAEFPSIHIEVGAYVDADYNAYLESNGLVTLQEKFDAMVLKYTSAAALYGLKEQLGYNVILSFKYLEIWPTNPSWYVLSNSLHNSRVSFCQNVNHTADVLVLHTKQNQNGSRVKGQAPVGEVCGRKCAIENTGIMTAVIVAHEMAHLLGTVHNNNDKCSEYDKTAGIMESNNLRWNECNAVLINRTVGSKPCLYSHDVTTAEDTGTSMYADFEFDGKLAGQTYSDDKICELIAGQGSWLRAYPRSRTSCGPVTCARKVDGGIIVLTIDSYIPGRFCGRNGDSPKICFKVGGKCSDVADTGLKFVDEKQGGWSDYGSWSSCSVTCGSGIQFRKRDCDNPVPVNSPFCEGPQYDLRMCDVTHPSCSGGDSDGNLTQVRQTTCTNLGDIVNETVTIKTSGHGQCEVTCSNSTALLPDGTPCTKSGTTSFCVQGYCEDFSAVSQIMVENTDNTKPGLSNREIIARIPAGASDVEFEFDYDDMEQNYLEIWTMENIKVLSPMSQLIKHTDGNPIFFASTYWSYDSKGSYLRSEQGLELSEPAFIKLHQKGSNENVGVLYRYIRPIADCTGSCSNNGTWNADLCSCDCPDGYYGQTCTSTCNVYCFNGYPLDSSCNCECDTNVTYGDNCRCQYAFTGKNCSECREPNNSLATNCRPTNCQAGCGGLDCKATCADKAKDCGTKSSGKCDYYKWEKRCQLTCGYCESSSTAVDCSSGK